MNHPICSRPLSNVISIFGALGLLSTAVAGEHFHVDATSGDDAHDGKTPATAWRTLEKASAREYVQGDHLLLRAGGTFEGTLKITAQGSAAETVVIDAYAGAEGQSKPPLVDSRGYLAGVHLSDSTHIVVRNLEIQSDAGEVRDPLAEKRRYGVFMDVTKPGDYGPIRIESVYVHDIFGSVSGSGIGIESTANGNRIGKLTDVTITNCVIEKTGSTGISSLYNDRTKIIGNTLIDIGGPGMQQAHCNDLLVRGNYVERSGSSVDPRMHARGSGIWPWGSDGVLIERNMFIGARGKGDSCGAHLDIDCRNAVVQYNLSCDNEGGFLAIFGRNLNNCYRYNISINDGARIKGVNQAFANGRILRLTGFDGGKNTKPDIGPDNSYIYNNTIYVKDAITPVVSVSTSTRGALVANNIFKFSGAFKSEISAKNKGDQMENVIFDHNYLAKPLDKKAYTVNKGVLEMDPAFKNPGSLSPVDYVPTNPALKGAGVAIYKIPGDAIGLKAGLEVREDFFGNPVDNKNPDLGAVVVNGPVRDMVAGARLGRFQPKVFSAKNSAAPLK